MSSRIEVNHVEHPDATPQNRLFLQSYEWYTPSEPPHGKDVRSPNSHWARLTRILPNLAHLGTTSVWLPPACKANEPLGNGYDCYDLWDLGEFDQKGSRSTKWGSKEELDDLMKVAHTCRKGGVDIVWDAVLNHKTAGDALDTTWAVECDNERRLIETSAPKKIESFLRYEFPGRAAAGMPYSKMIWKAEHFSGTEWDQRRKKIGLYKLIDDPVKDPRPNEEQLPIPTTCMQGYNRILQLQKYAKNAPPEKRVLTKRPGKGWADDVDTTFGNYDYLIFSNLWYSHPEVQEEILNWARWMIKDIGITGFRMDAAKHFSWNYSQKWIAEVQELTAEHHGKEAFISLEVWTGDVKELEPWLDIVAPKNSRTPVFAFDSALLYSFSRISEDLLAGSPSTDLRTIHVGHDGHINSLVQIRPDQSVTFVTNHDTQPSQASFAPMDSAHKTLFYAFILMRHEGYPCIFWGDLYGTKGPKSEGPACQVPVSAKEGIDSPHTRCILPSLMLARKLFAYGEQEDYFDAQHCIGWTRAGTHDRPGSATLLSIDPNDEWVHKKMEIGRPGERWVDVLRDAHVRPSTVIDDEGFGEFACQTMCASVYVREDLEGLEEFPVEFDHDVYRPIN